MRKHRSTFRDVRGLRTHVREWGDNDAPLLVMLHGWMDVGASFQFLVDALQGNWHVIAPDWRGFGLTQRSTGFPGTDGYWFPDYLADLDILLGHYATPGRPPVVIGHSMGGNVACMYAGIRPERISAVVSLEGFGLPRTDADMAPQRYRTWLNELGQAMTMSTYPDVAAVAARLRKNNPRLSPARAAWLAPHWAEQTAHGWAILGDPAHKRTNPVLYRVEEVLACWRAIRAPLLWVEARDSDMFSRFAGGDPAREAALRAEHAQRMTHLASVETAMVEDAGHMVHHDQPERCAALIERFLGHHA